MDRIDNINLVHIVVREFNRTTYIACVSCLFAGVGVVVIVCSEHGADDLWESGKVGAVARALGLDFRVELINETSFNDAEGVAIIENGCDANLPIKLIRERYRRIVWMVNLRTGDFRSIFREIRLLKDNFSMVKLSAAVVNVDAFWWWSIISKFKATQNLGIHVHPTYLSDDHGSVNFPEIFPGNRNLLLSYSGTDQCSERLQLLDSLEEWACRDMTIKIIRLDHAGSDRRLDPRDYTELLRRSQFALCPEGFNRRTHRLVEALFCGAIPILSDVCARASALPLRDGINCIIHNGSASSLVNRIKSMSPDIVDRMRRSIEELVSSELNPPAAWFRRNGEFFLGR